MPKKTFYNLTKGKKDKIINAAMDEFALNSYSDASVNRIIKSSGIAVGSFYQYFDDLKDLYCYILKLAINKKYQYFEAEVNELEKDDFISSVKAVYRGGIKYVYSDKRLYAINNHLQKNKDIELISELASSKESIKVSNYFNNLVEKAIANGEIRNDLSPKLVMSLIINLSNSFIESTLIEKPDGLDKEDYSKLIDLIIDVLIDGIGISSKKS